MIKDAGVLIKDGDEWLKLPAVLRPPLGRPRNENVAAVTGGAAHITNDGVYESLDVDSGDRFKPAPVMGHLLVSCGEPVTDGVPSSLKYHSYRRRRHP